ncbi:hypothetical protein [Streptomyces sp. NPDC058657]|uniref:hypothetical protein n=1 Tax=unclassified Streptomyces TaxID=2593676 RepID=UPI0036589EB9
MGVSMEVLIADFGHLRAVPADQREDLLELAAFGAPDDFDTVFSEGWTWPEDAHWYARYEFRGTLTSYKAHFWAGERWEKMRPAVEPGPRNAMDEFSSSLFWGEYNWADTQPPFTPSVPVREERWGREAMLWCPPEDVAVIHRSWVQVERGLPCLRAAFDRYAVVPSGWFPDFDSFAEFVSEWGDVVTQAALRGWGIIGLRC